MVLLDEQGPNKSLDQSNNDQQNVLMVSKSNCWLYCA